MNEIRKRILIIGAGAAGMAAATKLYENGITDIIVIEAENRIGGRINSIVIPEGDVLEMGAAYIHKRPMNCVLELAQSHDKCVASLVTFENIIYARSCGEIIKKDESEMMRRVFRGLHKDFMIRKRPSRKSFGRYVLEKFQAEFKKKDYDHIPHEVKDEFIENAHRFLNSHGSRYMIHGEHEQKIPEVNDSQSKCDQPPNAFVLWKDTGFKTLFDILLENCPNNFVEQFCSLNTEVIHISKTVDEDLRVYCSNKITYVVEHVICTVSVGVLQESYERMFGNFLLPEEKIRAIRGITFGTLNKIYLRFSEIWWPVQDCNGFSLLWTKQDRLEFKEMDLEWATGIFAITRVDFSPHILITWISGVAAKVMETIDEENVRGTLMFVLRKFLGAHFTIPDCVKCFRTDWFTNEHFRGAYGFRNLPQAEEEIWSNQIAYPVCNRQGIPILLFAGEASDPNFYSTAHGAVESGWREANRIISLKDSKDSSCDCHHKE